MYPLHCIRTVSTVLYPLLGIRFSRIHYPFHRIHYAVSSAETIAWCSDTQTEPLLWIIPVGKGNWFYPDLEFWQIAIDIVDL